MKMPTAAPMANLMDVGTRRTMISRMPKRVRRTKIEPEMKTIPIPTSQGTIPPLTRVKAKKALLPMAGARAKGRRA